MSSKINQAFLKDIREFFDGGNSWQAGLYQLVSSLTCDQALWKPSPERHCIWEILRHVNFWKKQAIAEFLNKYTKEDGKAGNWSRLPSDISQESWKRELEYTRTLHEDAVGFISEGKIDLLDRENETISFLRQMFFHDAYHAGQIGFLRVMQGLKPIE